MDASKQSWRALPVFLVLAIVLSEYPFALHALGFQTNPNPNPLGLLLAALIASAIDSGWQGPIALVRSMVRVRTGPTRWLAALGVPVAALAATVAVASTENIQLRIVSPDWSDLFDRFVFTFLFVGLGEEPAWRGFLQPLLQRQLHPSIATLCVAAIWSGWHMPLMGTEFAWTVVPAFLTSLVAASFVLAWLINASGSALLPMLMHTVTNTAAAGYVFHLVAADDLERFWWIYAGMWWAIALSLILLTVGRLGAVRN